MPSDTVISTSKKRKRHSRDAEPDKEIVDTSKPSAVYSPTEKPRKHTLSLALPGSILYNAHSLDLKTILAGQIARALAVFCVDEVVIFNDGVKDDSGKWHSEANDLMALLLSYMETPPHMRKRLFPMNPDLRSAGVMPSLDLPHHLRRDELSRYREGVTLDAGSARQSKPTAGHTMVDVGTEELVEIPVDIPPNTRVTIRYSEPGSTSHAGAVAASEPREKFGWYWGYDVRSASSLSAVFTECPWEGGYDSSIGTSERGRNVQEVLDLYAQAQQDADNEHLRTNGNTEVFAKAQALSSYSHLLLVLGGHQGLEVAARNDKELKKMGVDKPEMLFDWWVNLCPGQGSRTIRTEEAVWLGLMAFRNIVEQRGQ